MLWKVLSRLLMFMDILRTQLYILENPGILYILELLVTDTCGSAL